MAETTLPILGNIGVAKRKEKLEVFLENYDRQNVGKTDFFTRYKNIMAGQEIDITKPIGKNKKGIMKKVYDFFRKEVDRIRKKVNSIFITGCFIFNDSF